jgi:hypothetical protein
VNDWAVVPKEWTLLHFTYPVSVCPTHNSRQERRHQLQIHERDQMTRKELNETDGNS